MPIGASWASGSWVDGAWADNTWSNGDVPVSTANAVISDGLAMIVYSAASLFFLLTLRGF